MLSIRLSAFALALIACTPAFAKTERLTYQNEPLSVAPPTAQTDDDPWAFTLTPFLWAMGMEGSVGPKGMTAGPDVSFLDVLDSSDSLYGVMLHMEFSKDDFSLVLEPQYIYISAEESGIDYTQQMWFVELTGVLTLWEGTTDSGHSWHIDGLAGVRYTDLDFELENTPSGDFSKDEDWFDPIIGLLGERQFAEKWFLAARVDVGGFDVGCDFTWNVLGMIIYEWKPGRRVYLGYRALDQDYNEGQFVWDVTLHGPAAGIGFTF